MISYEATLLISNEVVTSIEASTSYNCHLLHTHTNTSPKHNIQRPKAPTYLNFHVGLVLLLHGYKTVGSFNRKYVQGV